MKTSFMRPAEGRLRALGKVAHATATLAFCAADIVDDAGQLCASATGTFKYLRALPSRSGLKTQVNTPGAGTPPGQHDVTRADTAADTQPPSHPDAAAAAAKD